MDGLMDERTDGRTDRQTDGWMDRYIDCLRQLRTCPQTQTKTKHKLRTDS